MRRDRKIGSVLVCAWVLFALSGCSQDDVEGPATSSQAGSLPESGEPVADSQAMTLTNLGVAQMGRFDYPAAAATFRQVVDLAPEWDLAQVNLAVATLNRQNPGDEERALQILEPLLSRDSKERARASYLSGILYFNQGQADLASGRFADAAALRPKDAYAHYFLGQTQLQSGQTDVALQQFQRAGELDPYLRSAYYGQFLAHQRLGDRTSAREMLEVYKRLENNPRSRLAEIKYTRMGPLAMAVGQSPAQTGRAATERPAGPVFAPPRLIANLPGVDHASVLTVPDDAGLNSRLQLFAGTEMHSCTLTQCRPAQSPFRSAAGAASPHQVSASAWADMDNNGLPDRVLTGAQGGLWVSYATPPGAPGDTGDAGGGWVQVLSDDSALSESSWTDLAIADADHDGDLDVILVSPNQGAELVSNNGDGSFRRLNDYLPPLRGARQVITSDLDGDRDLDLLFVGVSGGQQVLLNDRLWQYREPAFSDATWQSAPWARVDLLGAAAVDLNADGLMDLVGLNPRQLLVWEQNDSGWEIGAGVDHGLNSPQHLWVQSFTGQGSTQVLVTDAEQWAVMDLAGGTEVARGEGRVLAPVVMSAQQGPGLLVSTRDQLLVLEPGIGRFPFATLTLSGLTDAGQSMRSNASGLGTRVVAQGPSRWQVLNSLPGALAPGQNLQPLAIGLGAAGLLEAISLDWSDGVFQSELDLAPGLHPIQETQRQLASCPVLFQHNGESYQFVTDVLGVGGLGFNLGFGQYATPRPRESLLLNVLDTDNGQARLQLMLTEPMEELAYVDRVTVEAVDYPSDWHPRLDERMGTDSHPPSGDLLWHLDRVLPVSAVNHAGTNVTQAVLDTDLQAPPLPPLRAALAGLLTEPQVVELTFDADLSALEAPALVLDGWVEYGYSQTAFAAWQQGLEYDSVSLDIEENGQWTPWRPAFGYPAGMPRAALLPLGALPTGTRRLRLRTAQQIYFDQLSIVETARRPDNVRRHAMTLTAAAVRPVGFPRRSNGPQMQPRYDFADREPFWDTRYQRGEYTAYGAVNELLTERDNALAIIGPGDGLELTFEAGAGGLPSLPAGYKRQWLVTFDGWAKDMDLFTQHGETVAPLPQHPDIDSRRADQLNLKYNTRIRSGR